MTSHANARPPAPCARHATTANPSARTSRRAPESLLFSSALLLFLALSSCASSPIPNRERMHLELRYSNKPRQLAVSLHAAPFFRDASRRLLTEEHPEHVNLIVNPRGETIGPGELLEILPAGTKVRVLRVLFPSAFGAIGRPLLTPSDRIWLELAIDGRPASPTWVLVLPPDLESESAVVKAVERFVTSESLDTEIEAMTEAERSMITHKSLAAGVGVRALELAFRKPNLRRIHGDGRHVVEEWSWRDRGEVRVAHVRDGVVERVETVPIEAWTASHPSAEGASDSNDATSSDQPAGTSDGDTKDAKE